MYIEDKKKPNTNGPMLGQSESDSHIVMRRESDKVDKKSKVSVLFFVLLFFPLRYSKYQLKIQMLIVVPVSQLTRTMSDGAAIATFAYHKQKKVQAKTEKELNQRKQEAVERELCLQKSLSEECEDLGVDEPSTSDLFPEADLLFDSNNSPSFDQLSQDIDKKYVHHNFQMEGHEKQQEDAKKKEVDKTLNKGSGEKVKVEEPEKSSEQVANSETDQQSERAEECDKKATVTLFSDDDNSDSTLRTDLLFESLDYPTGVAEMDYNQREKSKQLSNGSKDGVIVQSSTSNFSGSYDDHHMMTNCASVSDASPTQYDVNSSPLMHKYKYKYCNRKRLLSNQNVVSKPDTKPTEDWEENTQTSNVMEVIKMSSSDEDTSESVERAKSSTSRSPSPCETSKRSASPSWEENNDESSHSYPNVYSSNKVLKLAMNSVDDSVCSADESSDKYRKPTEQCSLECMDSCSPPSPLSPEDSELEAFNTGRAARRSTQRLKKKCPCCTSPEKPKKINTKKLSPKGQFAKKR